MKWVLTLGPQPRLRRRTLGARSLLLRATEELQARGAEVDEAIAFHKPLEAFLAQGEEEATTMAEGDQRLDRILRGEETQN